MLSREALTRLNAKMRIQAQGVECRTGWGNTSLQERGRSGEVLNAYVEALPLAFHAEARQHRATAMAAETVEQARSLIVLASLITEHAHGRDEGRGLLTRAEGWGLPEALAERMRLAAIEALALARAARSALALARYDGARTLAQRCLAVDPTNADALGGAGCHPRRLSAL